MIDQECITAQERSFQDRERHRLLSSASLTAMTGKILEFLSCRGISDLSRPLLLRDAQTGSSQGPIEWHR